MAFPSKPALSGGRMSAHNGINHMDDGGQPIARSQSGSLPKSK
jgi:hypothetical protein